MGRDVGKIAADILHGKDPATIPIINVVPERLYVNQVALQTLKDPWRFPEATIAKADLIIDAQGVHQKTTQAARAITKTWKLRMVQLNNAAEVEETEHGFRQGLLEEKLAEGRDYELKISNAQADMATLNSIMDAVLPEADLIVSMSTPTLQVAMRKVDTKPVVFTYVSLASAAGLGGSHENHRANITGVEIMGPYVEMVQLVHENFPSVRRIGTLYVPAEANMVASMELLEGAAKKVGMEVVAIPINSSTDVADAALALTGRGIDAIIQVSGNITAVSFGAILQASNKTKIPVFAFTRPQALAGSVVSLSRDLEESGRMTATMVARIMRGENPKNIPIRLIDKTSLYVNLDAARVLNISVPPALTKRADQVIGR